MADAGGIGIAWYSPALFCPNSKREPYRGDVIKQDFLNDEECLSSDFELSS
jgi:hypothetical protein